LTWVASFYFDPDFLRSDYATVTTTRRSRETVPRLELTPEEPRLILGGPDAAIGPAQYWRRSQREYDRRSINLGLNAGALSGGGQSEIHRLIDNYGVSLTDGVRDLPSENISFEQKGSGIRPVANRGAYGAAPLRKVVGFNHGEGAGPGDAG
jgi:hypothetical protein